MLRIVYAGSPQIASLPLKGLLEDHSHKLVAVLTNPPSMKGRKGDLIPTPVESVAREFNESHPAEQIEILTPEHLDAQVREKIAELKPDILVCFAYGKIFGPKFMALFPQGGINLHPSLLPKYRGCAPVPASILNMDKESGITIQRVSQEMDAGNILLQTHFTIEKEDNSETILDKAADQGAELFLQVLNQIENKSVREIEQDSSKATYCGFLKKEDGKIDWSKSAAEIDAQIRAFYPWPGAFTFAMGNSLKVHRACVYEGDLSAINMEVSEQAGKVLGTDKKYGILVQTGNGILALQKIQWQTKKAMEWKDFLNGSRDFLSCTCGKE
ncbi:MAG: methionyl-tRNA formyltransferase [Treponemataceae bacterium]|nr:methionyl-tRNA formyltransferase [Treponemataceae bacterium]